MKEKILITGSNGMLGKTIVDEFLRCGRFEVFGINRSVNIHSKINEYVCDLGDDESVKKTLNLVKPDMIIHCAANVDIDFCEKNKEAAYKVNAEATRLLASYQPQKTKFIYISTDAVFDGRLGNYNEKDITSPLNYYARTKLLGEQFVQEENPASIIIRTNIYGFHQPVPGRSLVEWALSSLSKDDQITGFSDVCFNPVYTRQLAKEIFNLIALDYTGIIHIGCNEQLSKYEFLIKLAESFNLDQSLIVKGMIEEVPLNVARPKDTTLNTSQIKRISRSNLSIDSGMEALVEDYMRFLRRDYTDEDN